MNVRGFTVVVVATLLLATDTTVALRGAPHEDQANADLEKQLHELLQERVTTAERALDAMQAAFEAATVTTFDYLDAVNQLTEARLSAAKSPAQKLAALERRVERMRKTERTVELLYQGATSDGAVTAKDYFTVKRERQSAEIALIDARIKANR